MRFEFEPNIIGHRVSINMCDIIVKSFTSEILVGIGKGGKRYTFFDKDVYYLKTL